MVFGNVFQLLYNVVDSVVVGNYIGKEALAAVGTSFPVIFTLISLIIGVATGSTIIISQYFGAKKMEKFDEPSIRFLFSCFLLLFLLEHWGLFLLLIFFV